MEKMDEAYYRFRSQLRAKLSYQIAIDKHIIYESITSRCHRCSRGQMTRDSQDEIIEYKEHKMKVAVLGSRCNKCKNAIYDGPALAIKEIVLLHLKTL